MLDRIIPNLRVENIEIKRLGRDPLRRVQILEITKTYTVEEIEAKAANVAAIAKAKEADKLAASEGWAKQVQDNRAKQIIQCAEWLKALLASGVPMSRKDVYIKSTQLNTSPGCSRDIVNVAAQSIKVHEELRPEGKFWSLPAAADVATTAAATATTATTAGK